MPLFPPFRLDKVNQTLWRQTADSAEQPVFLNPKAFALLRYLIENSGRLVSHEELLDVLWPNVHVQPEVIKSHILAIRTALGDSPRESRYIETVRKRGYRFVATLSDSRAPADAPVEPEHQMAEILELAREMRSRGHPIEDGFDFSLGILKYQRTKKEGVVDYIDYVAQRCGQTLPAR